MFCHVMSFHALQVSIEKIYYASKEKPDKLFWTRLKEKTFAIAAKRLGTLESGEIFCVLRQKFLIVSAGPG